MLNMLPTNDIRHYLYITDVNSTSRSPLMSYNEGLLTINHFPLIKIYFLLKQNKRDRIPDFFFFFYAQSSSAGTRLAVSSWPAFWFSAGGVLSLGGEGGLGCCCVMLT